ncbi:fimbria/pilus outer membrane usher protein [Sphingobium baderi]|uniref:fimbria/pilus outer membrane usher protein n=1 Tax=Sphingobium baderi TaxID=1332080 RepID=UPI002B4025F7|nr:fimbria/pilus outer membrane usher protein [Sphingobium baderi]WRD78866.1 fimbria/pilus outer membrane usher protein [Sphingobium baderi]
MITLLLEVRVNGWAAPIIGHFRQQGARLAIRAAQFEDAGFRGSGDIASRAGDGEWIWLDRLPGVTWMIDTHAQSIDIKAPPSLLKEAAYSLDIRPSVQSRSDWGAMLSYDLYGQWSPGSGGLYAPGLSANLDARIFSPHFTATSTGLFDWRGGKSRYVRLDSGIVFDQVDSSQSLRLGDGYTAGPAWVRSIRFGGIQWARNFSLRPDIVTSPVARVTRDVVVPSTLDLFVNGIRSYSRAVSPGTVRLDDLPVAAGSNTVQMILTDEAGRRTQVSLPFYASSRLLAAGMMDFEVEAGFARLSYAQKSNDYGRFFASGTISKGMSDRVTLRAYAAGSHGYGGGALGATVQVGVLGVVDAALLASGGKAGTGLGFHIGIEHVGPRFSLSGGYTHGDSHYRDLAGTFDAAAFVDQATAAMGLSLGEAGNVNLAYAWTRRAGESASGIASATYRVEVGHRHGIGLSVSGYADTQDRGWGALLSASFRFGRHGRAYSQQSFRDGRLSSRLQLNGASRDERLSWQLEGSHGPDNSFAAQGNWRGPSLGLYGRVDHVGGMTGVQGDLRQSLIFMDGQFFISRIVDNGFTVVDVAGQEGVRVSLENRLVGQTDESGRILVPGLQPYVGNRVAINPLDLPVNADIKDTQQLVSPRAGGGLITRFAVSEERSALVTLVTPKGGHPPLGSSVSLGGGKRKMVLGYDGKAYVRGIVSGTNRLVVAWPDGTCEASFEAPAPSRDKISKVGPLTCAQ